MSNRELLGLAAKAAGYDVVFVHDDKIPMRRCAPSGPKLKSWNPLEDDGDALRLAVRLHIDFKSWDYVVRVFAGDPESGKVLAAIECTTSQSLDINGAARRAIVRAAAEIGRAMP